jgi:hypothetical protein
MNKIFLTILLLLSTTAWSQLTSYTYFPDSNAVWRETIGANGSGSHYEWHDEKFMDGDTLINGLSYHKIYESGLYLEYDILHFNIIDSQYYYRNLKGFIREDTNKKVFIFNNFNNQDELIYNFNLTVGDTIPNAINHSNNLGNTLIVSRIDSIFDGIIFRNQFFISTTDGSYNDYVSIIEGIGSSYGLFTNIDPPSAIGGILHCFMENDSIKYTDSTIFACDWISNVEQNLQEEFSATVYPLPFTSSATLIVNKYFVNSELGIYDLTGRKVKTQIIKGLITILDRDQLINGTYFYQLVNQKGNKINGKLLIE